MIIILRDATTAKVTVAEDSAAFFSGDVESKQVRVFSGVAIWFRLDAHDLSRLVKWNLLS